METMLNSLQGPYRVRARKKAAIARDLELSSNTIFAYLSGRRPIPAECRTAFENALGATVDWEAYEREVAALYEETAPDPPEPPTDAPEPPPEAPAPAARAPTTHQPAQRPSGGFFSGIIFGDDDD